MKFIENFDSSNFENVLELYKSVNWKVYSENPKALEKALLNSTYVIMCQTKTQTIGLVRAISDDISIAYLQDILVNPDFQKQGIATKLITKYFDRFSHVRTHMLLTDDEEKQRLFYEKMGYTNTANSKKNILNAFVKIKNVR